jgi:hypothetical protein
VEEKVPHEIVALGVDPAGVKTDTGLQATHAAQPPPPDTVRTAAKTIHARSRLASRTVTTAAASCVAATCDLPPLPQKEMRREINVHVRRRRSTRPQEQTQWG